MTGRPPALSNRKASGFLRLGRREKLVKIKLGTSGAPSCVPDVHSLPSVLRPLFATVSVVICPTLTGRTSQSEQDRFRLLRAMSVLPEDELFPGHLRSHADRDRLLALLCRPDFPRHLAGHGYAGRLQNFPVLCFTECWFLRHLPPPSAPSSCSRCHAFRPAAH